MFGKKAFALLAGYVAGSVISSLFTNKKGKDLKSNIKQAKEEGVDCSKVVINNFIETHKNLLDSLKGEVFSKKNKKLYKDKKEELLNIVEGYKIEGEKMIKELKTSGKSKASKIKKDLEKVYNEKSSEIEALKSQAPEQFDGVKEKILSYFEGFMKSIKESSEKAEKTVKSKLKK